MPLCFRSSTETYIVTNPLSVDDKRISTLTGFPVSVLAATAASLGRNHSNNDRNNCVNNSQSTQRSGDSRIIAQPVNPAAPDFFPISARSVYSTTNTGSPRLDKAGTRTTGGPASSPQMIRTVPQMPTEWIFGNSQSFPNENY